METLVKIMEAEELVSIFDIPSEMRNTRVEVTIRPTQQEKPKTTAEKIKEFREKHTHEAFVQHLKQKQAEGFKFDFDVQKVIDGTETEEDMQKRYRIEKRAWSDNVTERVRRGEL
jgi:hypothetical protein